MEAIAENTIIQKIQAGDKSAYEELFRSLYSHLCNFAFQFLKEQAASEEVVQEMFFKLWEKREELNINSSIKSYLFSSVRNHCLNQIKHLEIRNSYKIHNEQQIQHSEQQEYDVAVEHELQEKIEIAIQSLPPERQKIFKLSRFEGKKYREIAEELSLSVKTVEAQMSKALKFMREELKDYVPIVLLIISFLLSINMSKNESVSKQLKNNYKKITKGIGVK